jgi:ABC-type multidrug transport system fused ATPase/permease subunit
MSAGERQRLVIARALLKQAPVVVMDEPASNLDSTSEMEILASLRSALAGCSVLLVTHRLVAMDWMDEIVVLNAGRIIERGTHAELLIAGGLYARMWTSQNRMLSDAREYKQLEVS